MNADHREKVLAALRAITALLEAHEEIPEFQANVTFWVRRDTGDNAAIAATIVSALPGPWKAEQKDWGRDYLQFSSAPAPGFQVDVDIPAEDAGTKTGTKVVTEWAPKPEIAALLAKSEGDQQ